MKIVIFKTKTKATEYFNRDYSEIFSRIENPETLALTLDTHTPKKRPDGNWYYPVLEGADYEGYVVEDYVEPPIEE